MPDGYSLEDVLGLGLLASLLGISTDKLQEYVKDITTIPEIILQRLVFIIEVVEILRDACNPLGIPQWFTRERVQLNGRSPAQIFQREWNPSDPESLKVLELASSINV